MTVYQLLCLFGVPSLCAGVIAYVRHKVNESKAAGNAVKLGVQALLRAQMINDFNLWSEKGYAPIYARDNFENCWVHYHGLGVNGVMDDIHNRFMALPTEKRKDDVSC